MICVNFSCAFLRSAMTSLMSHSLKVVRMAAVCCAMTSWAAILRRRGDIFLRVKRSSSLGTGCSRTDSFRARGLFLIVGRRFRVRSQMRNDVAFRDPAALPVPLIFAGSSFSSVVIRLTAGERTSALDERLPADLAAGAGSLGGAGWALAGAVASSSITATTSPIFTSWPSSTLVSRTPAFSAVISVETLSVSRVRSASPASTYSPDFLCQTETTPLSMDSPTAGI